MATSDFYNLQRFVIAQDPVFESVCSELRAGSKRAHWMWFIFPQIEGLGGSALSKKFAISSEAEGSAYIEHPILGPRLIKCTHLVLLADIRSIHQMFSYPDDLKFHSCMTLFSHVAHDERIFQEALEKYFDGKLDQKTIEHLRV